MLTDLDQEAYRDGSLGREHKEYMGLAISFAAGCRDCVAYHLRQLVEPGATDEQIREADQCTGRRPLAQACVSNFVTVRTPA